jgi:tetratricopeptide (TPR) repeat protein
MPQNLSPSKGKKLLLFFLLAAVVPLLLITLIELSLRAVNYGYPTSFFIKEKSKAVYRANYYAAKRFFPGNLARKPLPEIFATQKTPETFRVFVLGESAARGESLADFSFSVILQSVLQHANPNKKIEVINTGIPAINSWVIVEIASELLDYEPDLVIVYAGHNEFIGPFGPASVFSGNPGRVAAKVGIFASALRLVQLLKSGKLPEELKDGWKGLQMFMQNAIHPGDQRIVTGEKNWYLNLMQILGMLSKNKVPTLVCTLPSNLVDCAPFNSGPSGKEIKAVLHLLKDSFNDQAYEKVTNIFAKNAELLKNHALAHWLAGRSYLHNGNLEQAKAHLYKSRDLDSFRVRTSSQLNLATSKAAKEQKTMLIDLEAIFDEHAAQGLTGQQLIYDHVHLSEAGHVLVAQKILQTLKKSELTRVLNFEIPDETNMQNLTGITDFDRILNLQKILAAMSQKPFIFQFSHDQQIHILKERLQQLTRRHNLTDSIYTATAADRLLPQNYRSQNRLALMYIESGQHLVAEAYFKKALAINPFNIYSHNNIGSLYMSAGKFAEAEKHFYSALKLADNYADAYFNLGICAGKQNNKDEAIKNYKLALQLDPAMHNAARNLANIYFKEKNFALAARYYLQGFKMNPNDINSLIGAANACNAQNQASQAIRLYEQAISLFPENPLGHYSLALAYEKQNNFSKAISLYEQAVSFKFVPAAKRLLKIVQKDNSLIPIHRKIELAIMINELNNYTDPWNLQLLGSFYAEAGELDKAGQILHQALAATTRPEHKALKADLENSLRLIGRTK